MQTTTGTDLLVERARARVSQLALASAMGVNRATVHRYEGLERVPPHVAERYRQALASLSGQAREAVA